MKGFIEVTTYEGKIKRLINLNNIVEVIDWYPVSIKIINNDAFVTEESYEQIKQLIKEAQ